MKNIKIYEDYKDYVPFVVNYENLNILSTRLRKEYDNMKFHIGDMVKLDGWEKFTFTIKEVELYSNDNQCYHLDDEKSSTWRNENEIQMAPDYEIDANKYNL
jgi:hypothetical protein